MPIVSSSAGTMIPESFSAKPAAPVTSPAQISGRRTGQRATASRTPETPGDRTAQMITPYATGTSHP
jgi:hypothetical protein